VSSPHSPTELLQGKLSTVNVKVRDSPSFDDGARVILYRMMVEYL
jgi:hypothetical protein